jgi:hypothetical protein
MEKQQSVAERQTLGDAISVGRIHAGQTAQRAAAFGIFGLRQMAPAGAGAQDLSAGRNLEAFGYGFLGFDAFGTSHKLVKSLKIFIAKERALYARSAGVASDFCS